MYGCIIMIISEDTKPVTIDDMIPRLSYDPSSDEGLTEPQTLSFCFVFSSVFTALL